MSKKWTFEERLSSFCRKNSLAVGSAMYVNYFVASRITEGERKWYLVKYDSKNKTFRLNDSPADTATAGNAKLQWALAENGKSLTTETGKRLANVPAYPVELYFSK